MAFSFGNAAPVASSGGNVQMGEDLEDIQTEMLGFLALSGESKIQLLPTAWPSDQLPPPTACLMSIASRKGLVAAAAPDAIILASTESVRKAFEGTEAGDDKVKPFKPQLKIPMPMRVSQLAFTADESYLVLSAENGGGLAVYDVEALIKGSTTESAFQIATNGQSLRALAPNPTPEKGELLALVTNDGNLMMANLKGRNFISGKNGQVLKDGVSCISWSTKGKQLVAGLANGTAYQMTPEGEGKAEIPRPPKVDAGDHISSITWLENQVFLTVHTPSNFDQSQAPTSTFHIVTRNQGPGQPSSTATFLYQKISDPAAPYGLNRSPPHHFILRLKDFPPSLQDVLMIASTASTDIGLYSRSKTPLTNAKPADKISGVFTMTEMTDDSRRAQLPMTAELNDTSPIGFALDLSSKEKARKPIPTDEDIAETPTPVPALMTLNNEGVLVAWWIIYSDSVRQGTAYPGLAAIASAAQPSQQSPAPAAATSGAFGATAKPAFGTNAFGSSAPAFGTPQAAPAFGAPSQPGAFGAPSGLGQKSSLWGTPAATTTPTTSAASAPAFGSSTFGSTPTTSSTTPAFGAPSFGATSTPVFGLGNRASPWASQSTAPNAAFGQASGFSKSASVFGSSSPGTGSAAPAASGFAAFATKGGFAAAGSPTSGGSIFGSKPATNPFSTPATNSVFGGVRTEDKPTSTFGSGGSGGFVLGSTFKGDGSAKDDGPMASNAGNAFFGGAFGSALGETAKSPPAQAPVSQEADMDSDDKPDEAPKVASPKAQSTTPASTPAGPKTGLFGTPIATPGGLTPGGLFGSKPPTSTPTATPASTGFSFGGPSQPSQPAANTLKPGGFSFANLGSTNPGPKTPTSNAAPSLFSQSKTPPSPKIKEEPVSETPVSKIPEAPLPPDTTSKTTFRIGESSGSSIAGTDAPLPPDFMSKPPTATDAPLPPDFMPKPAPNALPAPEVPKENANKPIPADMIPPSDVPGGPEDEGDDDSDFVTEEDEDESGAEEGSDEGSGEDVAKDLSPTSENNQTPGFTPQSSFGQKKQSPNDTFTNISRPGQPPKGRSLFGEGLAPPVLAPPKNLASPRSPSPVRNAVPSRMLRPDRVSSAPGFASQILGSRPTTARSAPSQDTFALSQEQHKAEEQRRAESRARKEAEETQMLVDKDDDDLQNFLASDIVGTKKLDGFQSRAEYTGIKSMDSVAAQVETVYRDINSMIDTLGLNARALQCYMKGHTEQYKNEGRNRHDLEGEDEWCLVEIENFSKIIERDLAKDLENGRVKDVAHKLETCNDLEKDLIRLRTKHEDIKKIIDSHHDPNHIALARAQPLSIEQATQQHDLRKEYTKFQKLLSEAEEALTLLKAKTVSQATSNGRYSGSNAPTVEAVMKTITKMTTMAEKRSGDIDVLEGQMRRLRVGSVMSNGGSREGSPFATPSNNRASLRNPGASTSSTYGLFYTPDSIKDTPARFQSSIMSNRSTFSQGSPRRKMSGYTAEEKAQLRSKVARKKEVMEKLRSALQKAGTNVRLMNDE
ncbi:related to nucleoporin [Phialocephala subalpina]|uniref:Related to nucleoporin n=1 Tax=Phialocephala subalpina TaxID=576137 RepID=A0A1L7WCV1_9HELO|nr:related to nucleoporin [Phialocephala subalpina]